MSNLIKKDVQKSPRFIKVPMFWMKSLWDKPQGVQLQWSMFKAKYVKDRHVLVGGCVQQTFILPSSGNKSS